MFTVHEVFLSPVYVESSGEQLGLIRLRRFQKELADIDNGLVVLSAPTGSGKTVTLLTDKDRGIAVGLYPNNELLRSQVVGLHSFITTYLGMRQEETSLIDYCRTGLVPEDYIPLNTYGSDKPVDLFGRPVRRLYIAGLSGEVVKATAGRGKLDVIVDVSGKLSRISEEEYAVILATPDTFFLLTLYAYGNIDAVGRFIHYILLKGELPLSHGEFDKLLRGIGVARRELERVARVMLPFRESTLFVDEYHLYGYYELSSFKALLYVLANIHGWRGRLVLSSATPRLDFQQEIAKEVGLNLVHVDGLSHVKEKGEIDELVRGPVKLVFTEVDAEGRNKVARLYRASEQSHELISSTIFREFAEWLKEGRGRGMVILEKVSHAELFATALHRSMGVKPVCMYSMPREDICIDKIPYDADSGLIVVGTGAKIGQGVEFPGVNFGVVARVSAPDFLQSLSRIGRKYSGESTVLIPLGERELEKAAETFTGRLGYLELAKWVEENGEPFMKRMPTGYERLYADPISVRESILKLTGSVLHYRLSSAAYDDVKKHVGSIKPLLSKLRVVTPPDHFGTVLMFRSTGPGVTYCREAQGEVKCYDKGEDLGTIIRNYSIGCYDGKVLVKSIGRGEVEVVCKNKVELEGFTRTAPLTILSWSMLRDIFKCRLTVQEEDGFKELESLNRELEDQLFMVPNFMNEELADYIYRTGKGLRVKLSKGSIILLYL